MATHFYEAIFTKLNNSLTTYVSDVGTNVIASIDKTAKTLLIIYLTMYGIAMIHGLIKEPLNDFARRIIRLSLIFTIALNIGYYNGFIAEFLWKTPDVLAGYIASGYSDGNTNIQYLDSLFSQINDLAHTFLTQATAKSTLGIPDPVLFICGFGIIIVGAFSTGSAFLFLILSKMSLAILLAIGPIFILLIMFEPTKRFFDVWFGQCITFVLLPVLISAGIKLILTILESYMTDATNSGIQPSIDLAIPALVLCGITLIVMWQLPAIASALGGGVAISSLGAVGWAYGKTKGAARITGNVAGVAAGKTGGAVKGMSVATWRKITGGDVNRINKG